MALTKDQILSMQDIEVKEIKVPAWNNASVYIKQLSRGQADTYLKRQYGNTTMKQDARARNQEISQLNIYGHDAYLCVCGLCDENGKQLFNMSEVAKLEEKNAEAIGYVASEIIKFSGMSEDVKVAEELKNG